MVKRKNHYIKNNTYRWDCNTEEAWSKPVGRLRSTLESWKDRSLTFTEKSTVINVLLLSQLVYIGTILTMPPAVFQEIMSMIWQFFWSGKTPSVSRETICRSKDLGGFGVIDLSKKLVSLSFLWVKRYFNNDNALSKFFFKRWLHRVFLASPVERAFGFETVGKLTLQRLPPFYRQVFNSWLRVKGTRTGSGSMLVPIPSQVQPTPLHCVISRLIYRKLMKTEHGKPRYLTKFLSSYGVILHTLNRVFSHIFCCVFSHTLRCVVF